MQYVLLGVMQVCPQCVQCRGGSFRAGIVETVKDLKISFCKTFDEDATTDICVSDETGTPLMPSDNIAAGTYKVTTDLEGIQHSYKVHLDQVTTGLSKHSLTRHEIS